MTTGSCFASICGRLACQRWRSGSEDSGSDDEDAVQSTRLDEARRRPFGRFSFEDMKGQAAALEAKGGHWKDPHFLHQDSSLFIDAARPPEDWLRDGERGRVLKHAHVQWRRPHEFCASSRPLGKSASTGQPTWLHDTPGRPQDLEGHRWAPDVDQGSLGDCYFMSALALATRDSMVCASLVDGSLESAGVYGVSLWVKGKWRMVWVDAYFPCWTLTGNSHGGKGANKPKPVFGKGHSKKAIWPMVVEKAFAKLHGSYQRIGQGGFIGAALEALTGGGAWTADASSLAWEKLRRAVEEDTCFVGAGSRHDLSEGDLEGIVGGHAYSVLHAIEISPPREEDEGVDSSCGGVVVRLLLLRNPWGRGEWAGEWGDKSKAWKKRPDVRAAVGDKFSSEDDGEFWIGHADFQARFAAVHLCRVKRGKVGDAAAIHRQVATGGTGGHALDLREGDDDDDWMAGLGPSAGALNEQGAGAELGARDSAAKRAGGRGSSSKKKKAGRKKKKKKDAEASQQRDSLAAAIVLEADPRSRGAVGSSV